MNRNQNSVRVPQNEWVSDSVIGHNHTIAKTTSQTPPLFFPRIIREFDDGPDEKPMIYSEYIE